MPDSRKVSLCILMVEDNIDDSELVLRTIRKGGYDVEYIRVDNAVDFARELRRTDWDLVLSDYSLPTFNGLSALKIFNEHNIDIPFILVSGTIGEEVAVEAMRNGAHDYLMKDKLARLVPAIQRELSDADVRQARREAERTLRHQAYHDILTGLPNRWLFHDRMEQALAYAFREEKSISVFFIDIDRFKNLNDTLGHQAGDHLLRVVAERLKSMVSPLDTIARLGGDDFVMLIPDVTTTNEAEQVAKKLLGLFETPFNITEQKVYVDVSIGIALYPENGTDADDVLKNAEAAMYYAKEKGRNNYQFCSEGIQEATADRFAIENELREAIKNDELVLYYQPQFSLDDMCFTGVETLVRWNHPRLGLTPPDKFIPVAEETGLIIQLGEWVIRQVAKDFNFLGEAGMSLQRVAINLSARQLYHMATLELLENVISTFNIPVDVLEIEITESGVMQDPEQAVANLNAFKKLGLDVAIDDFGTGYSSLSYLKRFPIDVLKIDRTFVRDIIFDSDDATIVRTILAMAQALNLRVVAEGVESQEQLRFLAGLGCQEGQGYFYARPMPVNELIDFMSEKICA